MQTPSTPPCMTHFWIRSGCLKARNAAVIPDDQRVPHPPTGIANKRKPGAKLMEEVLWAETGTAHPSPRHRRLPAPPEQKAENGTRPREARAAASLGNVS